MKPLFVVGTCAFLASVSLVVWGNSKGAKKVDARAAASQPVSDVVGKDLPPSATTASETAAQPVTSDVTVKPEPRTLVLGEGRGGFRLNALVLSDDAIAMIDELMSGMTEEDLASARFEIEGHTDSLGPKDVNDRIGLARAVAVKMYLCSQFELEPRQIKVTSYGAAKPVADNATQDGRALNRRVVVKVFK